MASAKRYFTGKPCKKGHVSERYTSTSACCECERSRTLADYHKNPAKAQADQRTWRRNNRGKHNAHQALRYAQKVKATPRWLTDEQLRAIEQFYLMAAERSLQTGLAFQVDHVIPLLNDLVCGLHVPWNLQVLLKDENQRKGNRLTHDNNQRAIS